MPYLSRQSINRHRDKQMKEPTKDRERVSGMISASFALPARNLSKPFTLHGHWQAAELDQEIERARTKYPGDSWVEEYYNCLDALTVSGMMITLPHFLRYSLTHLDSDVTDNAMSELARLSSQSDKGREFRRILNLRQIGAIKAYLDFVMKHYPMTRTMRPIFHEAVDVWTKSESENSE